MFQSGLFRQTFLSLHFTSLQFFSKSLHSSPSSQIIRLTKASYLHLLQTCKSPRQLKQIQTQMFRTGLHDNKYILNKFLVFCADPNVGNLDYAEKVFNFIKNPHLLVYNVMIRGFTKNGFFKNAILLFDKLRVEGVWPDNYTYPFVFKAVGRLGKFSEAMKIHGFALKSGVVFDSYVCNSLMDAYAELGLVGCLVKLFDEMPKRDVVSWNVLIAGYVKWKRYSDAILVFKRMRKETDLRLEEATVVSTLAACSALKDLDLGKEIHEYVVNELGFTTIIGSSLLDMYCKCGCLDLAQLIFEQIPIKNVICWTSMVSGYVSCGLLDEARELFEGSPVHDIVLWTAMINGYVQFNRFDEAQSLFREMQKRRIKADKFIVVALLTGCSQLGALEQGRWIHEYINENKIRIDAVVGTALIEMYAKCGCIGQSLEIFFGLREKDTTLWTSIICGLAMNGKTGKALELFNKMEEVGAKPDDITLIGVLSACSHGGLVKEGRQYFSLMSKVYNIEPKLEHYGCMVDLLGRAGLLVEAAELVEKIPNKKDEVLVPLYGSLLSSCRTHGNVEIGERMAKKLAAIESNESSVHTLLANIYASADRWEDVMKVRRNMKKLGVKKFPGCSSIEVDGIVHEFLVGDASHPKMTEISFMLNRLAKPLLGLKENELEIEDSVPMVF
ncbi:Pentatricopeptide repeat [Dillenia turbinata]|uniref:Pentatricopeptide repeat n=1 Tax=Dillenia turbinata TaxID=194707 RepID=A0AAN8WFI6_9MAGN